VLTVVFTAVIFGVAWFVIRGSKRGGDDASQETDEEDLAP